MTSFSPFCGSFVCVCVCMMILLFKMGSKYNAVALSSVPKYKKTVMSLMKEIYVLDKIHLGISYSAAERDFKAKEPTIHMK